MQLPLVSVIIPTYNRVDYLKLTLDSVVNQTYNHIEIIVVDDGTPNSHSKNLCKKYKKLNYIKIENSGGPAKPRNIGIDLAKGKYLAFIDDDDLWDRYKIEKQVSILESNPTFGLVHSYCQVINSEGVIQSTIIGKPRTIEVKHGDVSIKMIGNWTVMMPTSFIRKKIVDIVGLFNEEMPAAGEDTEFWIRCSFYTKFYFLNESLAYYRVHKNNISSIKKGYTQLPIHLKKVLKTQLFEKRINLVEYKKLINNVSRLQIKNSKNGVLISIKNLFFIDLFWFVKGTNFKMLVYILFFKNIK